jgi:hypothetical protein
MLFMIWERWPHTAPALSPPYVNLHNANFPGGEIRGQIPEPAAFALLGLGLLGLGVRRRSRAA